MVWGQTGLFGLILALLSAGLQVKELDKRSSGSAFQVILSPNAKEAKAKVLLSPERRGISLEEQKKKMTAAEERRKVPV